MPRKTKAPQTETLASFFAIADGIAALFHPFVEVVLHDLSTDCVAYVANPFSPREPGDPSDLKDVRFDPRARVIGPYEKINWDGRRLKAISITLRDTAGKLIGLLCVNADVTELDAVRHVLQGFLGITETTSVTPEFRDDWHERINRFVAAWTAERGTTLKRLDREGRRALITALHETGGFEGRRAPVYVATLLGVSRATIYNELAALKQGVAA